jgi:BolA family transcriptional regulator, general stress-responsive regulator
MGRKARIENKLQNIFSPSHLEVIDESHFHAGHAGAKPEGETHYRVKMQCAGFTGQTRLSQHRAINAALQDEFDLGLHALALETRGA